MNYIDYSKTQPKPPADQPTKAELRLRIEGLEREVARLKKLLRCKL